MILRQNGYFVTPKRASRKFSSWIRPDSTRVQEHMKLLEEMGLGKMVKVDRTMFFYKALPTAVQVDKLAAFRISIDQYTESIKLVDDSYTEMQRAAAEVHHPEWDSFKRFRDSNNLNWLWRFWMSFHFCIPLQSSQITHDVELNIQNDCLCLII